MDERIGRYRLLHLLATGGMGEIFLALAEGAAGFQKPVVVKRMRPELAEQAAAVEMFLNEARLAAPMSHPNVVQVFELSEADGRYFIALEYVHGLSLHAIQNALGTKNVRLPPPLVAFVCAQALRGLQHAHGMRSPDGQPICIAHRDVTPDNILVSFDGVVKVTDFGVAKAAGAPTTAVGTMKGKLAYSSPEQVEGKPLDCRVDLFAMGVVLYELLAGRPPFDGESESEVLRAVLQHVPPDVRSLQADVPAPLAAVVERALQKEPSKRFASADAMADALEDFLADLRPRLDAETLAAFLGGHFGNEERALRQALVVGAPPEGGMAPRATLALVPESRSRGTVNVVLQRARWPFFVLGAAVASAAAGVALWIWMGTAPAYSEPAIPPQGVILHRE